MIRNWIIWFKVKAVTCKSLSRSAIYNLRSLKNGALKAKGLTLMQNDTTKKIIKKENDV